MSEEETRARGAPRREETSVEAQPRRKAADEDTTESQVAGVPGEVRTADPGIELEARGATEFKEDAVTVTPVPTLNKEEMTVGGRYEKSTQDRIERRDEGINYAAGQCPNCGHIEDAPPTNVPRTQYMACPVCGDTIRFTGVGVRDPNAEPLPSIQDDEIRGEPAA